MNLCEFQPVDEPPSGTKKRYYCERCGMVTAPTASEAADVISRCNAPRGAGDVIANAINGTLKAIGINKPKCGGCKKRQRWLNKVFPAREE